MWKYGAPASVRLRILRRIVGERLWIALWYKGKAGVCKVFVMRSIWKPVACLCLLLTLWSAAAFVAHQHTDANESAKCTVCIAALSASPTVASLPVQAVFSVISTFRAGPVAAAKQRLIAFALSVRPPPPQA